MGMLVGIGFLVAGGVLICVFCRFFLLGWDEADAIVFFCRTLP